MSVQVNPDDPALLAAVATRVGEARRLLREIADTFSPAAFASSLGAEDMVLTDLIVHDRLDIEIFSLDTGRLPPETYDLIKDSVDTSQVSGVHFKGIEKS